MANRTQVPDGWRIVKLGDVAEVRGGIGFPLEKQGRCSGVYPFIKVSDMNLKGNETYIRSANNYIDKDDAVQLKANVFAPGTIVFPKVGAAIATNKKRSLSIPTVIDNNLVGITVSNARQCNARFLHNWFESIDLTRLANVSTVPSITASRLKREFILLPPLAEQWAIAAVLDAIEAAIECTEAVISATERLRDALLHDLLTRGVPGWHTEWRTVPGLGTIPADWRIRLLAEVAEVKGGKRLPKGASFADEDTGLPYIRVVDFRDQTVDSHEIKYLQPKTHDVIRRYTIRSSDIYISIAGTIGLVGIVPSVLDGANLTENAAKITILSCRLLSQYFLLSFLASRAGQGQIYRRINALGQPKLALQRINTISIPLPSICEQRTISTMLASVDDDIGQLREGYASLQSLKAAATNTLLTGRVRMANKIDHA